MSRSRKKRAITGLAAARSDKPYKISEHRRERLRARIALCGSLDQDDPRLHPRPFGDPWNGPKDGKIDWTGWSSPYSRWSEAKARRK